MSARFKDCLEFVLAREGGKVDDPVDRGGRTAYGVTQRVYDEWRANWGLPSADVWGITPDQVEAVYKGKYWNAVHGDTLPEGLDLVVFDAAVNHGPGRAIKFLQRALSVDDDGVFGPNTANALAEDARAGEVPTLIETFIRIRAAFYEAIVERDPAQARFAKGWSNRLVALSEEVNVA